MNENLDILVKEYVTRLADAGVSTPYAEARLILKRVLEEKETDSTHAANLERAIRLREARMPIERIFGTAVFYNLPFRVADNIFRPYPESEDMVHYALSNYPDKNRAIRILDLGTGTGCLLLALLNSLPHASGIGIDLTTNIIGLAQENAKALGLEDRAEFKIGNWSNDLSEKFDLIISNPPRVATADLPFLLREMRDYDPPASLDGGKDGLDFFRKLAKDFDRLSIPGALCLFQIGPHYAIPAQQLFRTVGFKDIETQTNFLGMPCCISVRKKAQSPLSRRLKKRFNNGFRLLGSASLKK